MKLRKLRAFRLFTPLFFLRDSIWTKLGLFEIKKSIKQKRYFKKVAIEDAHRRKLITEKILTLPDGMLQSTEGVNITVSMTSYGKRVEYTCPFAIYSILTQNLLPNRIILNLDKKKWNDENLPELIKKLQRIGVEVNYVEDIGPHTKFLPSLAKYPNDIIITADDDVLYDRALVSELVDAYKQSDKQSVICRDATCAIDNNGNYIVYSKQPHVKTHTHAKHLIPFGVAGVLYPPHLFSQEIFNYEIIRKLCPKADDIWFGIMEIINDIKVLYLADNSFNEIDVDRNEEFNPDVSDALHFVNNGQGLNDSQWDALVEHYQLDTRN